MMDSISSRDKINSSATSTARDERRKTIIEIPKIELHLHLEGALRLSTIADICDDLKLDILNKSNIKKNAFERDLSPYRDHFCIPQGHDVSDISVFFTKMMNTQTLLYSEAILERVSYEICEDAYNNGIKLLEIRYSPSFIMMTLNPIIDHSKLTFQAIYSAITAGIQKAQKVFDIAIGLIGIFDRTLDATKQIPAYHHFYHECDMVYAIDLAADEAYSCIPFVSFYNEQLIETTSSNSVTSFKGKDNDKNGNDVVTYQEESIQYSFRHVTTEPNEIYQENAVFNSDSIISTVDSNNNGCSNEPKVISTTRSHIDVSITSTEQNNTISDNTISDEKNRHTRMNEESNGHLVPSKKVKMNGAHNDIQSPLNGNGSNNVHNGNSNRFGRTCHAGESTTASSVREAIDYLNVTRIGHGFLSIHDETVLDTLLQKKIHLEICPVSNIRTGSVKNIHAHPVRSLFDRGVSISINSDDPGVFDSSIIDDYELCMIHHGFTIEELNLCNQQALAASFLPGHIKEQVRLKYFNNATNLTTTSIDATSANIIE